MSGWSLSLVLVVAMGGGSAWAKDKGNDHVVGALWSYTITREGKKETGQFRVFKKEMFHKDKKVGTVDVKDEDETTLHITGIAELNGKATLRKTQRHPPVAVGKLKRDDGTEWEMRVEVKEF
jgi:hypothetical protein